MLSTVQLPPAWLLASWRRHGLPPGGDIQEEEEISRRRRSQQGGGDDIQEEEETSRRKELARLIYSTILVSTRTLGFKKFWIKK